MAFIDDAKDTGRPLYNSSGRRMPRQIYTLAFLATSLAIWAVLILVIDSQV